MIEIELTSEFLNDVKKLRKRYRSIQADIEPVVESLSKGEEIGIRVSGAGYAVFKVRVKNQNIKKGKSGGYRLIYQLQAPNKILLLKLYSKSDTGTITTKALTEIIAEHQKK